MDNIIKTGDVIIQVDAISNPTDCDVCCLCLNLPETCNNVRLNCCRQLIHKQCLFLMILNGYNNCPLCRNAVQPFDYFDEKALAIHYGMMGSKQQDIYYHAYQELQYEISKIECKGFKMPTFNRLVLVSMSRLRRNFLFLLLVVVFYLSMMLLVQLEHTHHQEQSVRQQNDFPLEYYAVMNQ